MSDSKFQSFDAATAKDHPSFTDQLSGLNFHWPTPPYAGYPDSLVRDRPLLIEVVGLNGMSRNCQLVSMHADERRAHIKVPPSNVAMPLRFSQFQRIVLRDKLQPLEDMVPAEHAVLLDYRPVVDYDLRLRSGELLHGKTVGHVENALGVFLFHPLDDQGTVESFFIPREGYDDLNVGVHLGQVLVAQQSVTAQQVELAARVQQDMRGRKLGDYLVFNQIVSADQLLQALDQQSKMPMVRIGEALTALGLISDDQLSDALDKQKVERTVPLGELLVRSGQLTRQDLHTALARKMGYPVVDLSKFPVDEAALRKVPHASAQKYNVLPLLLRGGSLVVATDDPTRRSVIEQIEFNFQCKVVPALVTATQLAESLDAVYERAGLSAQSVNFNANANAELEAPNTSKLLENLEQEDTQSISASEVDAPIEQSDNSLVRLINNMIIDAHAKGVSDIHIETHPGKRKVRIRFRRDGVMSPYLELPPSYRMALVARIKIMCELDISERRKPQDGKIDFAKFSSQHKLELRVATIPTSNGLEDIVMRLLASAKPLPMDKLGLTPSNFRHLCEAVERPYGMVLCVGPTGSGKTTTLHSVLGHLNTPERKIWTAEDPVEITQPDLRQVQVNPKIDWTFAKALRAFLRADPDIIMVGEIRDNETAQTAVEASLTGHMVLSTLHTNSAPETVVRLLDMGIDPFNFADSLLAVLAQRLVRRLCRDCVTSQTASDAEIEEWLDDYLRIFPAEIAPSRDQVRAQWVDTYGLSGKLMRFHAPGCKTCDNTGFKGRAGVHELMSVTPEVRRLIQAKAPAAELQRVAMVHGHLHTLRQDGIEKVLAGMTTIDEVRATCN